jgi:hypothetical protein
MLPRSVYAAGCAWTPPSRPPACRVSQDVSSNLGKPLRANQSLIASTRGRPIRVTTCKVVSSGGSRGRQAALSQLACSLSAPTATQARSTGCWSVDRESPIGTDRHRRRSDTQSMTPRNGPNRIKPAAEWLALQMRQNRARRPAASARLTATLHVVTRMLGGGQ